MLIELENADHIELDVVQLSMDKPENDLEHALRNRTCVRKKLDHAAAFLNGDHVFDHMGGDR